MRARPSSPSMPSAFSLSPSDSLWVRSRPRLLDRDGEGEGWHRETSIRMALRQERFGDGRPPLLEPQIVRYHVRRVIAGSPVDGTTYVIARPRQIDSLHRRAVVGQLRRRAIVTDLIQAVRPDVVTAADHVDAASLGISRREEKGAQHVLFIQIGSIAAPDFQQPVRKLPPLCVPGIGAPVLEVIWNEGPPEGGMLSGGSVGAIDLFSAIVSSSI